MVVQTQLCVTIEGEHGCWRPSLRPGKLGYVLVSFPRAGQRRQPQALLHRATYEALVGAIPDAHDLHHHTCGNTGCANPWHTRPVPKPEHGRISATTRDQKGARHD